MKIQNLNLSENSIIPVFIMHHHLCELIFLVYCLSLVAVFKGHLDNNIQKTVDLTMAEYQATTDAQVNISAKMAAVEKKLRHAQDMLYKFDQPVSFGLTENVVVANPFRLHSLYSQVQLEFVYNTAAEGVLFFVENNATAEKLLLQLIGGHVVYEYANTDVTETVTSDTQLCQGCWFRVLATR